MKKFSLVIAVVAALVLVTGVLATVNFQVVLSKDQVQVDEKFFVNWIWGNTADSVVYTTTVPAGIYLNSNDDCRAGNGCEITYTMYNSHTGGQSVVTDAKALEIGSFTLITDFCESDGECGHIEVNVDAGHQIFLPVISR